MAKKEIYAYDYQNGIATQREKAFRQVMEIQSQYDFLGHKEEKRTASEIKRDLTARLERINKTLKDKLKTTVIALFTIIAIGLTSCDKEPIEMREMVTQEIKLTNIYAMPMTKGFDVNTWVYNYNTAPAVITFQNVNNPAETVTQSVTVAQLQQGISVTIFAGTYNITYETIHANTTTLDIKINMPNTTINGTPIALTATYTDFLIVVDVPTEDVPRIVDDANTTVETLNAYNGFYYAYYNAKRTPVSDNIYVSFYNGNQKKYIMSAFAFGNIYWYCSPIGAGTTITFPEWVVNKITI